MLISGAGDVVQAERGQGGEGNEEAGICGLDVEPGRVERLSRVRHLAPFQACELALVRQAHRDFTLGSEYANSGIRKFCNDLIEARSAKDDLSKDLTSVPALGQTGSIPERWPVAARDRRAARHTVSIRMLGSRLFDAFRSNLGRTVGMIQDARLDVLIDHLVPPVT